MTSSPGDGPCGLCQGSGTPQHHHGTILLQTLEALSRADDPQALVFGYRDVKQPFRRAAD